MTQGCPSAADSAGTALGARQPAPLLAEGEIARLTAQMAAGHEAAYRQFFDLYYHRLHRYLIVVCAGQEELARDALQGALLRVARHARRFDSEEAFWQWLAVLARSAARDEQRKQRRYGSFLERFFRARPPEEPAVSPAQAESQLETLLAAQLALLPAEDRALVEAKYLAGQPVKALAQAAGTTEKALESRLGRLRQKLKTALLAALKHEKDAG